MSAHYGQVSRSGHRIGCTSSHRMPEPRSGSDFSIRHCVIRTDRVVQSIFGRHPRQHFYALRPGNGAAFRLCRRSATAIRSNARAHHGNLSTITLDANTWRTLEQVNTAWNTAIKPEEDAAHYGRVDYWTIPKDGYGDCEDYALGKRKSLVDLGIPVQALRLTIARTGDGTAHTVLVAATDRGDYVLDNLNSAILPWTAVNYTWIARQIPGQTQWAFIGPTRNLEREFASAGIRP